MPNKKWFVLGLLGVLSGCASTGDTVSDLSPWIGKPASGLVEKWGPPSKTVELPSGEKQFVYEKTSEVYPMAYGGYGKDTLNPQTQTECQATWLVDQKGTLKRVDLSGSQCHIDWQNLNSCHSS